ERTATLSAAGPFVPTSAAAKQGRRGESALLAEAKPTPAFARVDTHQTGRSRPIHLNSNPTLSELRLSVINVARKRNAGGVLARGLPGSYRAWSLARSYEPILGADIAAGAGLVRASAPVRTWRRDFVGMNDPERVAPT